MLDKNMTRTLEKNILERINKMYPDDSSIARQIAKISAQVSIITLQEYEKLNSSNID